jgi:hypothetical protein
MLAWVSLLPLIRMPDLHPHVQNERKLGRFRVDG